MKSVRKMISACLRELAVLAKMEKYIQAGDKVIYANTTSSFACIYANKLAGGEHLHIAYPDFMISTVLQAFFGKTLNQSFCSSYMDSGCNHCGLNCIRVNVGTQKRIPAPTVSWNWGLHCNEAPKTDEMIDCLSRDGWKDVFITIPHDAPLGTSEADDEERVDYLASQIRRGQEELTAITGVAVPEEVLKEAMGTYMSYMYRMEKLMELAINADPQPISGNELALFAMCMQVAFDTGMDGVNDALDTAIQEVSQRVSRGEGPVKKGAPKLACHFVPLNIPWVDRAFRDNGVTLSLGRVFPLASWIEKRTGNDDIYKACARQCLMWPDGVNMKNEAVIISRLMKHFPFDGALFGFYDFDRWIGALHKTMIQIVEEETSLPHYYLEGSFWDNDMYSLEDRISIIRSICNCLKISQI